MCCVIIETNWNSATNAVPALTKSTLVEVSDMALTIILKICPACSRSLSSTSFYRNKSKSDGYAAICKTCTNKSNRAAALRFRAKQKERPDYAIYLKRYALKTKYGISFAEYEAMIQEQQGVCAICQKSQTESLAVDHCHKTGKVRGLLCSKCNQGIGLLGEDPAVLASAISYLA